MILIRARTAATTIEHNGFQAVYGLPVVIRRENMKLYMTDVNLFDDRFFETGGYIPEEKKKDLDSFRNPLSKKEHILAWSLLSYVYEIETGKSRDGIRLVYSEKGKPYLKSAPFFFNLSHSGGKVLCAVSKNEVGADVQLIKAAKPSVIKRVLCENEQKVLELSSDGASIGFMRFWTQKESYLKLTGEGISAGLSGLDFSSAVGQDRFRLFSKEFLTFSQDGFMVSVCFSGGHTEHFRLTQADFPDVKKV